MKDIDQYLAQQPLRTGKLAAWQDEIIALRRAGASLRYICRYLASNGVAAHSGEVHQFLHRCGRQQLLLQAIPRAPVSPPVPPPGTLPTFDWPPKKKNENSW